MEEIKTTGQNRLNFKKRIFFLPVAVRQTMELTLVLSKATVMELEVLYRVEEILLVVLIWKKIE